MLYQKNTLKFNSFSKGWIPNSEVFPNGNPNDSAIDIVNFDVDSVKGGLVKTNGYVADLAAYSSSLSGALSNTNPVDPHVIKYLHNYSLGIPLQADLLLAVAYKSDATQKYKWLLRDMIVNDYKLSEPPITSPVTPSYNRWYNLLLTFTGQIATISSDATSTTVELYNISAAGGELSDSTPELLTNSLDGFIANFDQTGSSPNYRLVIYNNKNSLIVVPPITATVNDVVTLHRSRLSLDTDFNSIFNPSAEYSSFVVNNVMSKLMVGLGKEVKPLWLGYINKHYFYDKTNSKYLLDYNGISCQRNIILEKRIPEFDYSLSIDFGTDGSIAQNKEIELYFTGCMDGYQEVIGNPYGSFSKTGEHIYGKFALFAERFFNTLIYTQVPTDTGVFNQNILRMSNTCLKFYNGTDYYTVYFIADQEVNNIGTGITYSWKEFAEEYLTAGLTNSIYVAIPFIDEVTINVPKFMENLVSALNMKDEHFVSNQYVGYQDKNPDAIFNLVEGGNNLISLQSIAEMSYGADVWSIQQSKWNSPTYEGEFLFDFSFTDIQTVTTSTNLQIATLIDGQNSISSVNISNLMTLKIPNNTTFHSLKIGLILPLTFNRRLTAFSIWGRYKPEDDSVAKWLKPFYLLKKIYLNDKNTDDTDNIAGWSFVSNALDYETYIKDIYGDELATATDPNLLTEEELAKIAGLKDIPQLLSTLKYEPSVGIAAKYGAATIHNNVAWIANTDDKVEVLRFSRIGSTGTNNLDVFSYDFDSSIGFEMIGQDSPGHITALASKDDELIVLRDNSFFSVKTGIETIQIKQGGNFVGCKYPRSVVTSRYGVIFADDNGIWLYQGLTSGSMNVVQINWQWGNAYLALADKANMFACWNGKTEEYWLCIGNVIYVADFKNIQSIDQSMVLMKEKEKILVPWRKKIFNSLSLSDFTIDSYGKLIFATDTDIYFDDLTVFSMDNAAYTNLYIESKVITQHSPMLKVYEVLTETLKDTAVNDWKFDLSIYVNGNSTARQTIKMWGNCNNQESLICVRPTNLGTAINDVNLKIDMGNTNGTTIKKLRAFGLNIMTRKEKYVSE